ncbi:MAG TPA: class I SAM-dependent methyltransferase [Acidimicrobiales bacterium]
MSATVAESSPAERVLDAYSGLARGDRFHVAMRWRSCPFPEVEAAVPRAGRVLEVGCGHGLFSLYLAATSPERTVVGVDIDAAKLVSARQAADAAGLPVTFAETIPEGSWDAITIVDVLYLLGEGPALDLLRELAAKLAPGGVLAVKEIDVRPRWKYQLARWQEIVATRVTRITEGEGVAFIPPAVIDRTLTEAGLFVTRRSLARHSLYPHLLLTARRGEA